MSHRIKVGVLRGGPSSEYDISLKTGAHILRQLRTELSDTYEPVDILVDRDGQWYADGFPFPPERLARRVDVVFNALHGEYGEDGKVQQVLDQLQVPYTGSGALASAIGYNKQLAKDRMRQCGISVPQHRIIPLYKPDIDGPLQQYAVEKAGELFRTIAPPWIIKPIAGGSSIGIRVVKTYYDLIDVLADAATEHQALMIEELIPGREATCAVVEGFRGDDLYALVPIEITPPAGKQFFDYEDKYGSRAGEFERIPGTFSTEEKKLLQELSKQLHRELGLRHYSRSDFIISPKGIYCLEVNTLPGLTEESLMPRSLTAVGSSLAEFIDHLLTLAKEGK